MHLRTFLWGLSWMVAVGLSGCDQGSGSSPASDQAKAKAASEAALREAPDFSLVTFDGKRINLKDFRGSPVVIHFWASWCPPCLEEIGEWVSTASDIGSKHGLKWLAINLDSQWTDAFKVLPAHRVPKGVISVIDPKMKVSKAYGSFQFPETYLINREGKIAMKWVGPQGWGDQPFREMLFKKVSE